MKPSMKDRRAQLQLQRRKIQKRIDHIQTDERQETAGGQTDTAHEWENADVRGDVLDSRAQELGQVDAALKRIDQGTYGICDMCGEPIADKRLEALPYATRCVACAAASE